MTLDELKKMLDQHPPCDEHGDSCGWFDAIDHEKLKAAWIMLPDLLRVVEAARAMVTVCQYPCGDPMKCGNCNALREALRSTAT